VVVAIGERKAYMPEVVKLDVRGAKVPVSVGERAVDAP
jgi:hypothetical protein